MAVEIPKNKKNRLDNLAHAHKVFIGKTWYEDGVGNPRQPLKIGNITEIKFKK